MCIIAEGVDLGVIIPPHQPTPTATSGCQYGPALGNSGECALSPAYAAPQPTSTPTVTSTIQTIVEELCGKNESLIAPAKTTYTIELGDGTKHQGKGVFW
jgi:hypothetical protein